MRRRGFLAALTGVFGLTGVQMVPEREEPPPPEVIEPPPDQKWVCAWRDCRYELPETPYLTEGVDGHLKHSGPVLLVFAGDTPTVGLYWSDGIWTQTTYSRNWRVRSCTHWAPLPEMPPPPDEGQFWAAVNKDRAADGFEPLSFPRCLDIEKENC